MQTVDGNQHRRGHAKRPLTRRDESLPSKGESRKEWSADRGCLWAQRLDCWSEEYDRLSWAENLPNLPFSGEDKPKANPARRKELQRVLAAVANILDESPAATLWNRGRDIFDVAGTVSFAEEMLHQVKDRVLGDPGPTVKVAANAVLKERAEKTFFTGKGCGEHVPAKDGPGPLDRAVMTLVVRVLEPLASNYQLGRRTPFRTLAMKIAAEVLDLPQRTVRRLAALNRRGK